MKSKIIELLKNGEVPTIDAPNQTLFPEEEVKREPMAPEVRRLRVTVRNEALDRTDPPPMSRAKDKRTYLFNLQKGLCLYCDEPFGPKQIPTLDHIIPKIKGGSNSIRNLCLVCQPCNSLKSGFATFEEAVEYAATIVEKSTYDQARGVKMIVFFKKLRDKGIIR